MAIIDDFKDIASRMKGELAPKREPLAPDYDAGEAVPAPGWPHVLSPICGGCQGYGENPPGSLCLVCNGKGVPRR